jgi:hypothetical protein
VGGRSPSSVVTTTIQTSAVLPREPETLPNLFRPFGELIDFLTSLSTWELRGNRAHWENYLASLGLTAVAKSRSILVLIRADSTEGVGTLTRELFELATRFLFCIDKRDDALAAALRKEINQLKNVENGVWSTQSSERIKQCEQLLEQLAIQDSKLDEPKPQGEKGSPRTIENDIYQWLCLDAHNRPGAILDKHGGHINSHVLTPFGQVSNLQLNQYLRFAARALCNMAEPYLSSENLVEDASRVAFLVRLRELKSPFELEPTVAPVSHGLAKL